MIPPTVTWAEATAGTAAAIAIDSQNLRRVIRALEVIEITGKPYTANLPQEGASYYPDAIWIGLSVPERFGGQGMPFTLAVATNEFVSSSNMAWSLFPGITRGAIQALLVSANDTQKNHFIPKMVSGEWTGTMCLTEPHCGTDLGMLKTKAVFAGDEAFHITGQKIFISGGEHDLTENIIHLVLARVEGDPAGTKGISLFIVPKMFGEQQNNVKCGSIEHKMGIKGSPACVMNYDGAVGYLLGERCKGLNVMFHMMNEARIGVGLGAVMLGYAGYEASLDYAKQRPQGVDLLERLARRELIGIDVRQRGAQTIRRTRRFNDMFEQGQIIDQRLNRRTTIGGFQFGKNSVSARHNARRQARKLRNMHAIGTIRRALDHLMQKHHIAGVIGLGAGAIAAYARRGDYFRFYEIDPQVAAVAMMGLKLRAVRRYTRLPIVSALSARTRA